MTTDAGPLGIGNHHLCEPCAKDTAVYGRCPRLARIDRPGTICERCLSDGRLLIAYRVCCEPEKRFGHTEACKKTRATRQDPSLQRFAVSLFATDPRVLALVAKTFGNGVWVKPLVNGERDTNAPDECFCLLQEGTKEIDTLGAAWDLAGNGHEPEATYRKEAENRALRMQSFHHRLMHYAADTERLTLKSPPAKQSFAKPLSSAEHQANLAIVKREEEARAKAYSDKMAAEKASEDERKRKERAERKEAHPECGARPPGQIETFVGERCNLQVHPYSDIHQYAFHGRPMSSWEGGMYRILPPPPKHAEAPRASGKAAQYYHEKKCSECGDRIEIGKAYLQYGETHLQCSKVCHTRRTEKRVQGVSGLAPEEAMTEVKSLLLGNGQ